MKTHTQWDYRKEGCDIPKGVYAKEPKSSPVTNPASSCMQLCLAPVGWTPGALLTTKEWLVCGRGAQMNTLAHAIRSHQFSQQVHQVRPIHINQIDTLKKDVVLKVHTFTLTGLNTVQYMDVYALE